MSRLDLKERTAILTGAGAGLGKKTAELLAEAGANVVIGDINNENAETAAKEIAEKYGVQAYGVKCDVTDIAQCKAVFDLAKEKFGKIDIVVNAAGICVYQMLHEADQEAVKHMVNINVFGTDNMDKLALAYMKDQGYGRVVNFSSVAGRGGSILVPHYELRTARRKVRAAVQLYLPRHNQDRDLDEISQKDHARQHRETGCILRQFLQAAHSARKAAGY